MDTALDKIEESEHGERYCCKILQSANYSESVVKLYFGWEHLFHGPSQHKYMGYVVLNGPFCIQNLHYYL